MIRRFALLAVLGLIPAVVYSAAPASAATSPADDQFGVFSAGSPTAHVGDLTVVLGSSATITGVTAHLIVAGTGNDVLDQVLSETASAPIGSSQTQSTWSVPTAITEAELPLDTYSINVDVTFADQTTQSATDIGTLSFLNEPVLTLTADHTKVGYDYSPTVNLSGTASILAPDGTTTPYATSPLLLSTSWGTNQELTTDANGNFTGQVSATGSGFVDVTMAATNGQAAGSAVVNLTMVTDPIRLSARLSVNPVSYGDSDTVTGTLSYLPFDTGTAYKPLAGQSVFVGIITTGGEFLTTATGTTNAQGGFSIKVPTKGYGSTPWTVAAGRSVAPNDLQFGPAEVNLKMTVKIATEITNFHLKLNQYWGLSFSGCLNPPEKAPVTVDAAGLVLQYSSGGPKGPWRTLAKNIPSDSRCGNGGAWFASTAAAPENYAYYRIYFPGNDLTGTDLLGSSSQSVLAWKYADRITGFSVSPHVVANNGQLTVRGQLQFYSDYKWRDYANQTIYVIFRQKGSSTWYWIVKAKTNSSGHFSATFKDSVGSATWSAEFEGNSSHLSTAPPGVYVRVSG